MPTALSGEVQKGPFVRASSVTVQELDSTLAPTGRTFQVTTNDDEGDFSIPVNVSSQYVEVIAFGYYFDELTNSSSPSGQLTLRALANLTSGGTVNVNLLTSMSEPLGAQAGGERDVLLAGYDSGRVGGSLSALGAASLGSSSLRPSA